MNDDQSKFLDREGLAEGSINDRKSRWYNRSQHAIADLSDDLDELENRVFIIEDLGVGVGVEGPIGPEGPQGIQGLTGSDGQDGPQGPQGLQGDTGPQGPQGVAGLDGPQGDQGIQGPQGDQGVQGIKGDTGDTGPQGLQGLQGDQGVQGIQGDRGLQGEIGLTGPAGSDGQDGVDGQDGASAPLFEYVSKTSRAVRFQSYPDGRFISASDATYGSSDVLATETAGTGTTPILEWENIGETISQGEVLNNLRVWARCNDPTNTPEVEIYIYFMTPDLVSRFSDGWDNDSEITNNLLYKGLWRETVQPDSMGQDLRATPINDFMVRNYALNFQAPQDGWITLIADPLRLLDSVDNDYFYGRLDYFWTPPVVV